MTHFLTPDTQLPPYMAFPRFLLDTTHLSETAKILYMLLLDRARLSQKNKGWTDEAGCAFIFFPIKDLAEVMLGEDIRKPSVRKQLRHEEPEKVKPQKKKQKDYER